MTNLKDYLESHIKFQIKRDYVVEVLKKPFSWLMQKIWKNIRKVLFFMNYLKT